MFASELVARAIALSDLQNSDFITQQDKENSLNESYRDIYEELIDNNDDYYLLTTLITPSVLNNTGNPNEYLIDLPADCYKLRFVDYQINGNWQSMPKMPLSSKNWTSGSPLYRWNGKKLWVIGSNLDMSSIRVGYYPKPTTVTVPQLPLEFGTGLPDYDIANISYSFYVPENRTLVYVYGGNTIRSESLDLGTTTTLKTGITSCRKVWFYRGYLYWLSGIDLYRAQSDLLSPVTGTVIISGTVQNYGIFNDKIYMSTASNTQSYNLDGTGSVVILAFTTVDYQPYGASNAYIAGGTLWINGINTTAPATQFVRQGDEFIWLQSDGTVKRGTWDGVAIVGVPYKTTVNYIGDAISGGYLPLIGEFGAIAFSTIPDTEFDYPANAVWELMAYQMGADFMRKGKQDFSIILQRRNELVARFRTQIRRDDYQVGRINNSYQTNNYWGQ